MFINGFVSICFDPPNVSLAFKHSLPYLPNLHGREIVCYCYARYADLRSARLTSSFDSTHPFFHRVKLLVVLSPTCLQSLVIAMLWGDKNVAHNDIKPANMMVSQDGVVSLVDFGAVTFGEESIVSLGRTSYVRATALKAIWYLCTSCSEDEAVCQRWSIAASIGVPSSRQTLAGNAAVRACGCPG